MENDTRNNLEDQSGQTLVEFILLLAAIVIISFSFLKLVNGFTIQRWESLANIILDDKNQILKIQ